MKRVILPIVLILFGAALLAGCFYLPAPHPTENSNKMKLYDSIGASNSKRAMCVGQATRAMVLQLAPDPQWASPDGKTIVYSLDGVHGYWVLPLCFQAQSVYEQFGIRLNFDNAGILRSYKFLHGSEDIQENVAGLQGAFDNRSRAVDWPPPLPTTRPSPQTRNQ